MDIKTISLPLPSDEYDHTDQQVTRRITEQAIETISSRLNSIEKLDSNQLSNAIRKKQFLLMGATEQASKLTTTAEIADGAVTSAKLDTNITVSGTLDSTGKLTADAGIDVDNFNIDGTTIALSSGNMTVDVAGSIILNADGGQISFQDDAVEVGVLENSSSDFKIESKVQDKDIIFAGNDGGSGITPLTLDMSEAGEAIFAGNIRQNGGVNVSQNFFMDSGSSQGAFNFSWFTDGASALQSVAHMYVQQGSGDGAARKAEFIFQVADNGEPATALTIANNKNVNFGGAISVNNPSTAFTNVGFVAFADGGVNMVRNADTVTFVNRYSDDGAVISICQDGSQEGTISVSGATVSYNGFSGNHESSGIPTNTPVGTVVSTIDELDVYADKTTQPDNTGKTVKVDNLKAGKTRADHAKVKVSDTVGDSAVYGVVNSFDEHDKAIITSVGIGSVKVTGACSKGDLLESNGDGTAKVQSDDIVRSKTIGKVTIGNSNTGVKLVSCVLYCG